MAMRHAKRRRVEPSLSPPCLRAVKSLKPPRPRRCSRPQSRFVSTVLYVCVYEFSYIAFDTSGFYTPLQWRPEAAYM